MRTTTVIISVMACLLALLLALFAGTRTARSNGPKSAPASPNRVKSDKAIPVIRFARNPEPVPAFLVRDLSGEMISTAEFSGKVVLINFWATWCPPCREEIPELIELQNEFKDRFQVIGVSLDEVPPEQVKQFALQHGINYPIVMASPELSEEYGGTPALPTNFLVNTDGRVVQKHVGLYPVEVYNQEIRALLNMPVDAKIETFEDVGQIFLKNAANATELPGVELAGLSPEQKKLALKLMNAQTCNCGCGLTIAQCRINDSACAVSKGLAAGIVASVSGKPSPTRSSPAQDPTSN